MLGVANDMDIYRIFNLFINSNNIMGISMGKNCKGCGTELKETEDFRAMYISQSNELGTGLRVFCRYCFTYTGDVISQHETLRSNMEKEELPSEEEEYMDMYIKSKIMDMILDEM